MVGDALRSRCAVEQFDNVLVSLRVGDIHEPADALTDQSQAGSHNVRRDEDRGNRVQGSQPVSSARHSPTITPRLVQQSVRTCFPLAVRMTDFRFFPIHIR